MSIKILTKTGEEITAVDDARAYNFDAGNRSGIVKGAYNEGRFFSASNNVIALDSCELRIAGHRVVIDSAESITLTNTPANNTRYSMIAEIVVNDSSTPSFRLFIQPSTIALIKDNLYKTTKGNGTYQLEIGRFTLSPSGLIEDVVRTADVITGGGNGSLTDIEFNATAYDLESNKQPEVSVDFNEETKKYDMSIGIPRGQNGLDGSGSNPNILLNGDFKVNQRGQNRYLTTPTYTVDGWVMSTANTTLDVLGKGVRLKGTSANNYNLYQFITEPLKYAGKTVTFSLKFDNNTDRVRIRINDGIGNTGSAYSTDASGVLTVTRTIAENTTQLRCIVQLETTGVSMSVDLLEAKLEVGSVATAFSPKPYEEDLASCQVISGGLATTYSNPNLLINGDFRVNQRGQTEYNFKSSSGGYTSDRWFAGALQKITVNEGGSITQTKSLGSTNKWFVQWIEDYSYLLGKTITISMKVKNGVSGVTYRLGVYDGSYTTIKDSSYSTNGEQIVSVTINVPTTVKNNKLGVIVYPYQTYVSNSTEQVSITVDWVKAELGSVATAYSPRPYAEELALCEWFFKRLIIKGNGNYPIFAIGSIYSATKAFFVTNSNMRIVPTSIISGGNFVVLANGTEYAITSLGVSSGSTTNGIVIEATSSGMIAGNSCGLYVNKNREAYIDLDAEIN